MSVYGSGFDRRKTAAEIRRASPDGGCSRISPQKQNGNMHRGQPSGNGHPADLLRGLDRDQLLAAALMLLLLREGGDKRLLIALGYIIL